MKKTLDAPRLIDWVICDDVRHEINGKTTLVGIYGSDMIVNVIPAILPQLVFHLKWDVSEGCFKKLTFRFVLPDQTEMGPVIISAPNVAPESPRVVMQIVLMPIQIKSAGMCSLFVKIDEKPEQKIGGFEVKLSK